MAYERLVARMVITTRWNGAFWSPCWRAQTRKSHSVRQSSTTKYSRSGMGRWQGETATMGLVSMVSNSVALPPDPGGAGVSAMRSPGRVTIAGAWRCRCATGRPTHAGRCRLR